LPFKENNKESSKKRDGDKKFSLTIANKNNVLLIQLLFIYIWLKLSQRNKNPSDIHLKVSNTLVSIGNNGHYGNSYNTKKVYVNNNRNRFSKTSNNTSKYYTNSRNSNKRIVTTKKIITSNNSFNRNSKTIVRKTRIIR